MCPPSKKSLFTLAVRVRYQKVLCKDWKVSEYCPAGDWCNRWTFCTVVQHTAPGLQILPSSVLPSFAFDGTSFLSMETNGQLLVHWVSRGQGVKSNLHSKFLLLRGLSSHPWKIYAGWWWSQLGDTLTRHQFLLWKVLTRRSLPSFHFALLQAALTYFGQWLLNKRRHEKNHKESKLRLNTTLPLLSRLRLTKAGRSNNYSAQTSGFFRCPLIFIFSLHHHPH